MYAVFGKTFLIKSLYNIRISDTPNSLGAEYLNKKSAYKCFHLKLPN